MISFDDFKKVELTVGKILSAEKVPETEKLLRLVVDFGSPLEKGVPPSSEGRVVTTPALADPACAEAASAGRSGTPFIKGDTTPQSPPSEPLRLADSALPLGKEGRQDHPTSILPSEEGRREARDIRQIISGIAAYFPEPQALVGRKCMFVTNIEPRMIKGLESNGMILAVSTDDGKFSLLEPSQEIPEGTRAR